MSAQKSFDHSATSYSPTTVNVNAAGTEVGTIGSPFYIAPVVTVSGGTTNSHTVSAATTNATLLKAGLGKVYNIYAFNTSATDRFLKLYNKATAPVPGTDTPVKVFKIPANGTMTWDSGMGSTFALGIGFAITALAADLDATVIGVGEIVLDIDRI